MGLGDDIRDDVINELGTKFTVLRDAGDITGERLLYETNRQVTKPFIREFFLECVLSFDTETVAGDWIEIDNDGRTFIVMNLTPEQFENEAIEQQAVLYKCNVSGELFRPSGEVPDGRYHTDYSWQSVRANCYALLTETLFGHELETDENIGQMDLERHELYLPASVNPQIGDRYEAISGEFLEVESIKKRRYDGAWVCNVSEDTR